MVTEIATFKIRAGEEDAFEKSLFGVLPLLRRADGFIDFSLQRCVETPSIHVILIHWTCVDAHVKAFRHSDDGRAFGAALRSFFEEAPVTRHFEVRAPDGAAVAG